MRKIKEAFDFHGRRFVMGALIFILVLSLLIFGSMLIFFLATSFMEYPIVSLIITFIVMSYLIGIMIVKDNR